MKDLGSSSLVADAALVISAAERLSSVMYNYSAALQVLVDGVVQGYMQSHPDRERFVLDGDLVSSVESSLSRELDVDEVFAAMSDAYSQVYNNLKNKAERDKEAMTQDEWVERSLLELLPKMNKHVYARLAAKYIQQHGTEGEKGLSEVLNDAVISTQAMQSGVMVGVHRSGQALGAMIADRHGKDINVEKAYALYCVSSYVGLECFKAISSAVALPKAMLTLAASGFVDGLVSQDEQIERRVDDAKAVITNEAISGAIQSNWEDFEVARNIAMKKREKFDKDYSADNILKTSSQKAGKVSALKGREIIASAELGGVGVGKGALWVGDTAVSLAKAAGALGSNLLYSGCKLVGKGAKLGANAGLSLWYGPDAPTEVPRAKGEDSNGKDR